MSSCNHQVSGGAHNHSGQVQSVLMTTSPYPDEGLHGFLLRVAEQNFYERLHWVAGLADIASAENKSAFMLMAEQAETLAEVTSCDPDALLAMGYTGSIFKGERTVSGFGGKTFPAVAIEYKTPKVCPECLLEAPYLRQVWDLSLMTVCPHHGTRLINVCPDCGMPITWNRANVESCECGGDFTFAETEQASEPMIGLTRIIWNSLASTTDCLDIPGVYPKALEGLGYMEIGKVCSYLDGVVIEDTMISSAKLHGISLDARYEIQEQGAQILWNWPKNWHAMIQQKIDQNHDGRRGLGLQKTFGKMYEHLFARENDGAFDFLRDEFTRYLQDSGYAVMIERKGNARLLQGNDLDIPYMTSAEVRLELDIGRIKMDQLIRNNVLEEYIVPEASGAVHRITRESVEAYKIRPRGKVVGARQVSDFLGISLPSVMKLLEAEVIPASRGVGAKGREPWRIHSDDAIAFREQINARTAVCDQKQTTWLFSYRAALGKLNAAGVQVEELIDGLLSGGIVSLRTSQIPARLDAMFFDPEALDDFLRQTALPPVVWADF